MMHRITILLIMIICFKTEAQTSVLNIADSLYNNGNYTKAIEQYETYKNQSEVFDRIAKSYMALGNYDAAIENYEKGVKSNPKNALIKFEYARLLSKTKKYNEAAKVFNDLVYVDYKNPNYHYELGMVLEKLKDSTAQNRFYNAFQLDSTHQKAIYRLAKHNLQVGHNKLADRYIDIGLSTYENNKELINLKAQNFYVKKRFDSAVIWFEKLLALNEKTEFVYEKLSISYSNILDYENGIKHGEQVLLLNPTNVENLYRLGQLHERLNDFAKAEEYVSAALALEDVPLDNQYIQLGMVLNRQKKHKEAIDAYKKAFSENPKNDKAYFYIISTKEQYYEDLETIVKGYESFKTRFPKSKFVQWADYRIKALKEENFLKAN